MPMQRLWQGVWVGLLGLCLGVAAWAGEMTPVPPLSAPVMDTANMMQPQNRAVLNQQLTDYASQHGSQIVVLTVPSIAPETPFDYSTRVMDRWQLGRRGVDDGVLLLLVRDEHKSFLAVGRGLEGAIPDVYAKRILQDVLRPYLQQGQTDAGIQQAVLQIENLINGEALPAVTDVRQGADDEGWSVLPALLLLVFVGGGMLKALFGRALGSLLTGGLVLVASWLFGWALALCVLAALLASVFAFVLGSQAFIGGGGSGHWGGGLGGGGLGSGGGFSGGGGGFGGGGASGDW